MEFLVDLKGTVTSSGGGNATVPNTAPIQPPQAFVDNILAADQYIGYDTLNLSGKGITHISSDPLFYSQSVNAILSRANTFGGDPIAVDLSGNALDIASVNGILANFLLFQTDYAPAMTRSLDLSGQTPAAPPSGQGTTDKAALITAGWTVTTD